MWHAGSEPTVWEGKSPLKSLETRSFLRAVAERKNIDIAQAAASALWPSPTQTKHHQRTSKATQTS